MFCFLEIFEERTGITSTRHSKCSHASCKFCEASDFYLHKNPVKKSLTAQKYSWKKEWFVELDETFTNKYATVEFKHCLRLIHPLYDDIWIVFGLNLKSEKTFYKIFYGDSVYQVKTLDDVNDCIAKKAYSGRPLHLGDFES